jgi:hypothetical protein
VHVAYSTTGCGRSATSHVDAHCAGCGRRAAHHVFMAGCLLFCRGALQVCGWECCWGVIVVVVIEDGTWVTLCHLLPFAGDAHAPAAYCFSLLQPAAMQHVAPVPAATSACVCCFFLGCCVFDMGKESVCGFGEYLARGQIALLCRSGGRCAMLTGPCCTSCQRAASKAHISPGSESLGRCDGQTCSCSKSNHVEVDAAGRSTWWYPCARQERPLARPTPCDNKRQQSCVLAGHLCAGRSVHARHQLAARLFCNGGTSHQPEKADLPCDAGSPGPCMLHAGYMSQTDDVRLCTCHLQPASASRSRKLPDNRVGSWWMWE